MNYELKNCGVDISFSCMTLDRSNGMKNFVIMSYWQLYGTNCQQIIYTQSCQSHTKPSLLELKKAIHFTIVAPVGEQGGSHLPHRPRYIRIANRWGQDMYNAIRFDLINAGIQVGFQTRAEAEKECAEEGTDPDGVNLLYDE